MEIYFGVEMGGWTHSPALTQGRTAMEFMSFLLAMLLTRQEGKNKINKKKKKKEKRERETESPLTHVAVPAGCGPFG